MSNDNLTHRYEDPAVGWDEAQVGDQVRIAGVPVVGTSYVPDDIEGIVLFKDDNELVLARSKDIPRLGGGEEPAPGAIYQNRGNIKITVIHTSKEA